MMDVTDLQKWLNTHGQSVAVDGQAGPATRAAIMAAFVNKSAPAVTPADLVAYASRLGCTNKQLSAVGKVESGGSSFDDNGRPKMLYERHIFHRLTEGKWDGSSFSNAKGGGYNENSWEKLCLAACRDPFAAFSSASWGKYQEMGFHWHALGYASPIELAYATVQSEAAHYDLLARFIEANGLVGALRKISTNAEDNRAFAAGYNGKGYREFNYHVKLAAAMK